MKKNFIKKTLASTLAFAMVASVVPVAPAAAAKAPALNKTGKVLYLNENEVGSTFNFNVVNQVKGSTYKWTSADKTVATVNAKTGVVTAQKVGTVKVTCKITLPTKKTKTLTATVSVKENAVKAAISNPVETMKINEEYNFNKSFTTASGGKCTDFQNWVLDTAEGSNTAGATVDAKSGKVTATKAGSFKIKVQAYQNATKLAAGDVVESEWVTVKVATSLVSVKQTATNKMEMTFDDTMKDKVKASDLAIKNKATNVVSAVKAVSYSTDGKVVTVETFADYLDGATYVLTYNAKDTEFTTTIGAVASIEVAKPTVFPQEATKIEYVLKNANGVDITSAKKSTVQIEQVENKDGFLDGSSDGAKLTIFTKDKTAKIKITYHTYDYKDGKEQGVVSQEFVYTCVDKTAATIGAYKQYTITDKNKINWNTVTTTDTTICKNDKDMYLHVQAKDSADKDVTGLVFESSDNTTLLVSTDGTSAKLKGVKEGSAYVIVKNDKGVVLWSLPVTVKAESKASQVSVASTNVNVSNFATADPTKVAVTVKNQFGTDIGAEGKFTIEAITKVAAGKVAPSVTPDKGNVSVDATSADPGTYEYWVVLKDNTPVKIKFVVTVQDGKSTAETTAVSWKVELDKTNVDSKVTGFGETTVTAKVVAYNAKGVAVKYQNCAIKVLDPDNKEIPKYSSTSATSTSIKVVEDQVGTSTTEAVKLRTGLYKVVASVVKPDGTKLDDITVAFIVNDTQAVPTATREKETTDNTSALAAAQECFKVKSASGEDMTIVALKDCVYNGKTVSIGSVIVYEKITGDDGKTVEVKHEVKVNTYLVCSSNFVVPTK